mmetsp:Transcript_23135/g.64333  ORF Transcript_23135/g.64333 Transcript_23135/m.64333 type:complete len:83 (+) Transcript_23135:1356-1604(+)
MIVRAASITRIRVVRQQNVIQTGLVPVDCECCECGCDGGCRADWDAVDRGGILLDDDEPTDMILMIPSRMDEDDLEVVLTIP